VKKTAEPVMNVPSPTAKRMDWIDSDRASGLGGSCRCHHDCLCVGVWVVVPSDVCGWSIAPIMTERLAFVA
jgi:hypothetical protein